MDPITVGLLSIFLMLVLMLGGVPIVFALGAVSAVGMYLSAGSRFMMVTLETLPFTTAANYTFVVIVMFVLMGELCSKARIIEELYEAAHRWTAKMKGNLLVATILSATGFAAASGSTLVSSSVFSRISLPEMKRFGYSPGIAAGCIAGAGTIAALIPPSLAIVFYAALADESIGAMLIAGVIPGLLTALGYLVGMRLLLVFFPQWAPDHRENFTLGERFNSLKRIWPLAVLVVIIIGGIYKGVFSPSAAGAAGAAGALILGASMGRVRLRELWQSLLQSVEVTARLFVVIITGLLLSRYLLISGFINEASEFVVKMGVGQVGFMLLVCLLYLFLGMFVDSVSLMVITLPFLLPIVRSLGIDGVWFGIVIIKLIEISAITPPVGLNLYAVLGSTDEVTSTQLFKGVLPFVFIEVCILVLLLIFPQIILWLPSLMMG